MLYAYSTAAQTVPVNGNVVLATVDFDTNCSVNLASGSTNISLNKAGFYKVSFSATVANTTATAGNVVVQANVNGTTYGGATTSTNTTSTTDLETVSMTFGVHVKPNCCQATGNVPATLTFQNTGIAATFTNVNVVVTKEC